MELQIGYKDNGFVPPHNKSMKKNKALVGIGSCDNVQTETSIFNMQTGQGFKYKELVRPAGLSSWSVQLVRPAGTMWQCYNVAIICQK